MRWAVSSSGPSSVRLTSSALTRLAWVETLTAAIVRPLASRTGAAIERSPSSD
jgi:hypothetical protein